MRHLERLCVEIGPRPIGSKGNHVAADYIQNVFQAAGLDVERQEFPCPDWEHEETRLEVDGHRLGAAANWFSPPCDITASSVALGTIAELEAADLTGHIGIMYGDLTREGLSPKGNKAYNPERHQKIVQLLEENNPTALITVNLTTHCLGRLIVDFDLPIPSATVPAEVGLALLRQGDQTLHLRIASHRSPGHSCNVVGTKAGTRPERIVLCAHYDTVLETPGAIDNGSGVAVLLTLAKLLPKRELSVGLEFIAFSGEEGYGLGDEEYLRRYGLRIIPFGGEEKLPRHSEELGHILGAVNADGVGQRLGANTITAMASSQPFKALVSRVKDKYRGVVWVDPWPASNHYTFYSHGVPSIAISSVGVTNVGHLPTDTVEWISPAKLGEVVSLVTDVVVGWQDKSLDWCRESRIG
jgi:Iap family predicted aminopeptidase